jgi:hypothetical protein
VWNQLASEVPAQPPDAPAKPVPSASKEKPKEDKPEKKAERPAAPSPWDDLRAHPSAFLTTRLNRAAMWPFPMGRAADVGPELWWESGTPSHVYVYSSCVEDQAADAVAGTSTGRQRRRELSRRRTGLRAERRRREKNRRRKKRRRRRTGKRRSSKKRRKQR